MKAQIEAAPAMPQNASVSLNSKLDAWPRTQLVLGKLEGIVRKGLKKTEERKTKIREAQSTWFLL